MPSVVGARGQITIEKSLREAIGIGPGWLAVQRRVGDVVEVRFVPPRHRRSVAGALAAPGTKSLTPTEERERAWTAAAREKWTKVGE